MRKAHLNGHLEATKLYGALVLQEFVYASDVRSGRSQRNCEGHSSCVRANAPPAGWLNIARPVFKIAYGNSAELLGAGG